MEYTSCSFLNGGICFVEDRIMFCCKGNSAKDKAQPVLVRNFHGGSVDWEEIFQERNRAYELLRNGSCPEYCAGCIDMKKQRWFERDHWFDYVLFSTWTACNCACLYCNCNIKPGKYLIKDINKYAKEQLEQEKANSFDLRPTVYDLISNGYISKHTTIDFAGGEPTIYPYFDDIVKMLLEAGIRKMVIHTNGIKFSKVVETAIKKGVMEVVVSPDSGSKECYEKIKRVSAYNQVWANIKKYAKAKKPYSTNGIALKYVIMPGINDTKEELDLWIKKGLDAGINTFILNGDDNFFSKPKSERNHDVLKRIVDLADYFQEYMQDNCCQYILYTNCVMAYEELGIEEYLADNHRRMY